MLSYQDFAEAAQTQKIKIGQLILQQQGVEMEKPQQELQERMRENLQVMRQAVLTGLKGEKRSLSGLSGGEAVKIEARRMRGESIIGGIVSGAIAKAIAVAEVNAGMGRIVAAPTAGSCGVLPAVILTLEEVLQTSEEDTLLALFTAAGLGMVINERATLSGAEGGCQAEIGSAAGMAAAAAVEMAGGSPEETAHAAAIALKSFLGLVCDPVAGLVEVPCIKRNATATAIALTAAEMALSGLRSVIPVDEVIDTMGDIGKQLPCSLKETARGGLAVTPTARKLQLNI